MKKLLRISHYDLVSNNGNLSTPENDMLIPLDSIFLMFITKENTMIVIALKNGEKIFVDNRKEPQIKDFEKLSKILKTLTFE